MTRFKLSHYNETLIFRRNPFIWIKKSTIILDFITKDFQLLQLVCFVVHLTTNTYSGGILLSATGPCVPFYSISLPFDLIISAIITWEVLFLSFPLCPKASPLLPNFPWLSNSPSILHVFQFSFIFFLYSSIYLPFHCLPCTFHSSYLPRGLFLAPAKRSHTKREASKAIRLPCYSPPEMVRPPKLLLLTSVGL